MFKLSLITKFILLLLLFFINAYPQNTGETQMRFIDDKTIDQTIQQILNENSNLKHEQIKRGVEQVANLWLEKDGTTDNFINFCRKNIISDTEIFQKTVNRFEKNLESINGHFLEIYRDISEPLHLDIGPMLPIDYQFVEYAPWAHFTEDFFKTKIAFSALLNFPLYTLEERIKLGNNWTRNEWAQFRLVEHFSVRVPPEISQQINKAYVNADNYISNYNIYMHHIIDENNERLFPKGLKLISHWGLRDELKARYVDPEGLTRQNLIQIIMEKIIRQEIPEIVINNPEVDWLVLKDEVQPSKIEDIKPEKKTELPGNGREPDIRYKHLLNIFKAEKTSDPYFPTMPSHIKRKFQRNREIPEKTVEELFISVLKSSEFKNTANLIEKRLGRKLKPFDIWYNGFKPKGTYSESELDKIVSKKYPDLKTFDKKIPDILKKLGFDKETAQFLGLKIKVDPARGAGHAIGAERRADNAHLRTRVPSDGMNYKGYNIACHELGHNCEQVLSLNLIDHTLLSGVPNTAFTEAFAFVFQNRDLELLGLSDKNPENEHLKTLDVLWSTCEIAGVSLVDMKVWNWMYNNPDADYTELKNAVILIAKEVWNTYFAPIFGINDVILLSVYSHMIDAGLYLPDYPLGHIIAFQIEQYLKGKVLGKEMVRMCTIGAVTPDKWMKDAVNTSISTEPLLKAASHALEIIN
jgi:hypothetical protein